MIQYPSESVAAELRDLATFESKYQRLPEIITDWLDGHLAFENARIMDFGCGVGTTALGMAVRHNSASIVGVEMKDEYLNCLPLAQRNLGMQKLPENLSFRSAQADQKIQETEQFDCVYSWSVFEHVQRDQLESVVRELKQQIRPGGYKFLQVAPLYYSAYGSHLREFLSEPWAHLTMQLSTLKEAVLGDESAEISPVEIGNDLELRRKRAWSCFETLNLATADELLEVFRDHGFSVVREYRTSNDDSPPSSLLRVYDEEVLTTEQIVVLFRAPE